MTTLRTYLICFLKIILRWLEKIDSDTQKKVPLTEKQFCSVDGNDYIVLKVIRPGLLVDILAQGLQLDLSHTILWTSKFTYEAGYVGKGVYRFPEEDIQSTLVTAGFVLSQYPMEKLVERYPLPKGLSSAVRGVYTRVAHIFITSDKPCQQQKGMGTHSPTHFLTSYGKGSIIFVCRPNPD